MNNISISNITSILFDSPSLAYETFQVKYLPEQLEIYYEDGRYIMTVPRMNTKP